MNGCFLSQRHLNDIFMLEELPQLLYLRSLCFIDDYARLAGDAVVWRRDICHYASCSLQGGDMVRVQDAICEQGLYFPYEVRGARFFTVPYMVYSARFEHRYVLKALCPNPFTGVPEAPTRWCDLATRMGHDPGSMEALGDRAAVALAVSDGGGKAPNQGAFTLLQIEEKGGYPDPTVRADLRERVLALKRSGFAFDVIAAYMAQYGHDIQSVAEAAFSGPSVRSNGRARPKKLSKADVAF